MSATGLNRKKNSYQLVKVYVRPRFDPVFESISMATGDLLTILIAHLHRIITSQQKTELPSKVTRENIPVSLEYSKSASSKIRPWIAKMRLTDLNRFCDPALEYLRWDVLKKSTGKTLFQSVLFFKAWRVFDYLHPRPVHRPLTQKEAELRCPNVIVHNSGHNLIIKNANQEKSYNFDHVFAEDSKQVQLYQTTVFPLIPSVVAGYNCTVFAYGQTGTGKTHTMTGNDIIGPNISYKEDTQIGLIPRAASQLFHELSKLESKTEYAVRVSYIEIYNEEVRDLLSVDNVNPLKLFDDPENRGSICMKGLKEYTVCSIKEICEWLELGFAQRQTAATNLNRHSSRSHTVFTMLVHTRETSTDGEDVIKTGKLHLVDLAGSENIGRSGATEARAREAGTINKSLLTLGKVIKALAHNQQYVPYRDSKLTRILQDSLGGNTKTCMIATFSPAVDAWDETLSTLDYALTARNVANCPHINESKQQTKVLTHLKQEIVKLQTELSAARSGEGFFVSHEFYDKITEDLSTKTKEVDERRELQMKLYADIQKLEAAYDQQILENRKIQESFETTREHLNKIQRDLRERELENKKDRCVLEYLDNRERELSEKANVLLNVVETATRRESIYHKKFENMCQWTTKNAMVARTVGSMACLTLSELQNSAENHIKPQTDHLHDIQTNSASIKHQTDNILRESDGLLDEAVSVLTADSAIEPEMEGRTILTGLREHETTLTGVFDQCADDVINEDSLPSGLDELHETLRKGRRQLEGEAKVLNSVITEGSLSEDQHASNLSQFHESLMKTAQKLQRQVSADVEMAEQLKTLVEDFAERGRQKLSMMDELFLQMTQVNDERQRYLTAKPSAKISQQVATYTTCQTNLAESLDSKITNVKDTVSVVKSTLNNSLQTKKEQLRQRARHLVDGLGTWTQQKRNTTERFLGRMRSSVHKSKDEFGKIIRQNCDQIDDVVEESRNSHEVFLSDLRGFVKGVSENVQTEINSKVVSEVHVGDTPVRTKYEYPKKIDSKISPSVLHKRLMEEEEEAATDKDPEDQEEIVEKNGENEPENDMEVAGD